jgi:hypothetical protein
VKRPASPFPTIPAPGELLDVLNKLGSTVIFPPDAYPDGPELQHTPRVLGLLLARVDNLNHAMYHELTQYDDVADFLDLTNSYVEWCKGNLSLVVGQVYSAVYLYSAMLMRFPDNEIQDIAEELIQVGMKLGNAARERQEAHREGWRLGDVGKRQPGSG